MNKFEVNSYQLAESKKWAPAGTLFVISNNKMDIQKSEFLPEYRFDTKKEADKTFRNYYLEKGFIENIN